ncbi:hypothetical protein AAur_4202 [Paenarthrobacter aurescens TC1]|uniref:Uncharacterized protein n=1 Tax=Paenarthrobacter aurescens (strain TC1) TaxID=290340 RepID=A1RCA5_PAEAT|nr:hypothetical protein AAur_4202 [Paenarthrobacter aurescens TC1]
MAGRVRITLPVYTVASTIKGYSSDVSGQRR